MGQEIIFTVEVLATWKQVAFAVAGFMVRLLWFWESPINWVRTVAAIIFMVTMLFLNRTFITDEWRELGALFIGLFTNNIIKGLFRLWNVSEDAIMIRVKRWINSDKN